MLVVIPYISYILTSHAASISVNCDKMMIRNMILKQYLRLTVPMIKKISIYKEKIIGLYYDLPYRYYSLSEEDKLLLENVVSLL